MWCYNTHHIVCYLILEGCCIYLAHQRPEELQSQSRVRSVFFFNSLTSSTCLTINSQLRRCLWAVAE